MSGIVLIPEHSNQDSQTHLRSDPDATRDAHIVRADHQSVDIDLTRLRVIPFGSACPRSAEALLHFELAQLSPLPLQIPSALELYLSRRSQLPRAPVRLFSVLHECGSWFPFAGRRQNDIRLA